MRTKTRRADSNHERGNRRNENGNPRIIKGSDRQRPLPNQLGAINKEKAILEENRELLFSYISLSTNYSNRNLRRYKKFNARVICFRKSLAFCREW
jgi:hypothetical protein